MNTKSIIATLTALLCLSCTPSMSVYTVPAGVEVSSEVTIKASAGGGKWQEVPAVQAYTAVGSVNNIPVPEEVYRVYDGIAKVNLATTCATASVRSTVPVTFVVGFNGKGEVDTLTLAPGEKTICCPKDDPIKCVILTVDESGDPDTDGYTNRIVFKKGYHTAAESKYITTDSLGAPVVKVPDNTVVILEDGAHVCAAFDLDGVQHVKICGNGYINLMERASARFCADMDKCYATFREGNLPAVYIHRGCSDVKVEGIKILSDFRGITCRCSKGISMDGVSILTNTVNGDGINLASCSDVTVENSLVHSSDDCFATFNSCDSILYLWDEGFEWPSACRDITMRNCVLWTTCRTFCIGGHGTGVISEKDNIVEDIVVEDCLIAGQPNRIDQGNSEASKKHRMYWSGVFRILSQSNQIVRDITFRDIRFNWTPGYYGQPFHVCVRDSGKASYAETGGYLIEDILFENIEFNNCQPGHLDAYFKAPESSDDRCIRNMVFKNVRFDDKAFSSEIITREGNVEYQIGD